MGRLPMTIWGLSPEGDFLTLPRSFLEKAEVAASVVLSVCINSQVHMPCCLPCFVDMHSGGVPTDPESRRISGKARMSKKS